MSELFIVVGLKAKEGKEDELRRDLDSRPETGPEIVAPVPVLPPRER